MDLSCYQLKSRNELKKWLNEDCERTMIFYRRVYTLLDELKPGVSIHIPDICKESSYELLIKMVCLYILECSNYPGFTCFSSYIEFSLDFCTIKRVPEFVPSVCRRNFYSSKGRILSQFITL